MRGKILGILSVLILLCLFLSMATAEHWYEPLSSKFLKLDNIMNLLSRLSLYGILGIGVAFVIITGGIDLSIGSLVCLSGVLLSILLNVSYEAESTFAVKQITATQQLIETTAAAGEIPSDSIVRFTGGIGSGVVFTIAEEVSPGVLRVEEIPPRDEPEGELTLAVPVRSFDVETLTAEISETAAKAGDQLQIFLPNGAVSVQTIVSVSADSGSLRLQLEQDPGKKYHTGSYAAVLRRDQFMPIPLAVLCVLAITATVGLTHGLLITRLKLQPFVVTLCGLLMYRGISRWLTGDNPAGFGELQEVLGPVASGRLPVLLRGDEVLFGIPIPFFLLLGLATAASVFLTRTIWGRYLLALGRSEEAARFSGINTQRVTILAYVICSVMAGISGMLFAIEFSSISPSSFGNSFELYAIAAAVLGGCSLRGGEGSIPGVVIGTAVMMVLYNLIMLMRIPQSLEYTIIGAVILLGVLGDELVRRAAAGQRLRQDRNRN